MVAVSNVFCLSVVRIMHKLCTFSVDSLTRTLVIDSGRFYTFYLCLERLPSSPLLEVVYMELWKKHKNVNILK